MISRTSTKLFQEYLQKQADIMKEFSQNDEELYMRKFELSNLYRIGDSNDL